jgi:integrase
MPLKSVLDAYEQFSATAVCQSNPRVLHNLRTALRRYILPVYGFSPEQLKRQQLEARLAQLPLPQFLGDTTRLLEQLTRETSQSVASRSVTESTMANYRSAVTRFLDWLYSQSGHAATVSSPVGEYAPQIYSGQTLTKLQQGGQQLTTVPYALKEQALTATLQQQFQQFELFWVTATVPSRHENALQASTLQLYKTNILCFLGWLQQKQVDPSLPLELAAMTEPLLLQQFLAWGQQARANSHGWALNITKAALAVARWLADTSPQAAQRLDQIQAALQSLTRQDTRHSTLKNESVPLSYDESLQVLEYLKACCAPRQKAGLPRSELALMKAWQRYLIVSLLVYTPIRQSELRALKRGQSLVRDAKHYRVVLSGKAKAYKEFALPNHLTADFDRWFDQFWPLLQSTDKRVFARPGANNRPECLGEPLSPRDISHLVASAVYKATAVLFEQPKRPTIHTFRKVSLLYLEQLGRAASSDPVIKTKGQIPSLPLRAEAASRSKGQIPDPEPSQSQSKPLEALLEQWQAANTTPDPVE